MQQWQTSQGVVLKCRQYRPIFISLHLDIFQYEQVLNQIMTYLYWIELSPRKIGQITVKASKLPINVMTQGIFCEVWISGAPYEMKLLCNLFSQRQSKYSQFCAFWFRVPIFTSWYHIAEQPQYVNGVAFANVVFYFALVTILIVFSLESKIMIFKLILFNQGLLKLPEITLWNNDTS